MNQIDNIMALARECEFVAGDSEAYDRCRQTLRTAIEQAINACGTGAGCLHKAARIEALEQELATIKESLTVQEPVVTKTEKGIVLHVGWGDLPVGAKLYTAPQPQPKQEPVAWMYDFLNSDDRDEVIRNWITQDYADIEREKGFNVRPLYIRPPKREWLGLTDEEIDAKTCLRATVRYFEALLKEKNGGGA